MDFDKPSEKQENFVQWICICCQLPRPSIKFKAEATQFIKDHIKEYDAYIRKHYTGRPPRERRTSGYPRQRRYVDEDRFDIECESFYY